MVNISNGKFGLYFKICTVWAKSAWEHKLLQGMRGGKDGKASFRFQRNTEATSTHTLLFSDPNASSRPAQLPDLPFQAQRHGHCQGTSKSPEERKGQSIIPGCDRHGFKCLRGMFIPCSINTSVREATYCAEMPSVTSWR